MATMSVTSAGREVAAIQLSAPVGIASDLA